MRRIAQIDNPKRIDAQERDNISAVPIKTCGMELFTLRETKRPDFDRSARSNDGEILKRGCPARGVTPRMRNNCQRVAIDVEFEFVRHGPGGMNRGQDREFASRRRYIHELEIASRVIIV